MAATQARKIINGHHLIATMAECTFSHVLICPVCDGGLDVCRDCGAAEIELDDPCLGSKEARYAHERELEEIRGSH